MSNERHWRYRQAADYLGIAPATLRGMVAERRIPHRRLSRRLVLFDPIELRQWAEEHRVGPVTT